MNDPRRRMEVREPDRKQWREMLESQGQKIGSKSLHQLRKSVHFEEKSPDGDHVVVGTNHWGNPVRIKAKSKQECYRNLATLNGFTVVEEK